MGATGAVSECEQYRDGLGLGGDGESSWSAANAARRVAEPFGAHEVLAGVDAVGSDPVVCSRVGHRDRCAPMIHEWTRGGGEGEGEGAEMKH